MLLALDPEQDEGFCGGYLAAVEDVRTLLLRLITVDERIRYYHEPLSAALDAAGKLADRDAPERIRQQAADAERGQ